MRFHDRAEAGDALAARLRQRSLDRPWVLALRGGALEVAAPVAKALGGQLVPVPVQRAQEAPRMEQALRHGRLLEEMGISGAARDHVAAMKQSGSRARRPSRPHREPLPGLTGRDVLVVDDGMSPPQEVARLVGRAAAQGPSRLLVALPLADAAMREALAEHEVLVLRERASEGIEAAGYLVEDDADAQLRIWHAAREQLKRLQAAPRT